MKNLLRVACGVLLAVGISLPAAAQVLTGGQVLATNATTFVPATNGAPSSAGTLAVGQIISQIGSANFTSTNQLGQNAYLTINGILVCQLIQKWGPGGSSVATTTNLIYNPTGLNNTSAPDIVYTLPTNLVFGITYGESVTNYGGTNGAVTINRTQ